MPAFSSGLQALCKLYIQNNYDEECLFLPLKYSNTSLIHVVYNWTITIIINFVCTKQPVQEICPNQQKLRAGTQDAPLLKRARLGMTLEEVGPKHRAAVTWRRRTKVSLVLAVWYQLFQICFSVIGLFTAVWLVSSNQIHSGAQRGKYNLALATVRCCCHR